MSETLAVVFGVALAFVVYVLVLYFARSTPVKRVSWLDGEPNELNVATSRFASTFALFASTPMRQRCVVEVLANGDETFPRLWDDLSTAESLITWQVFWVKPGQLADRALDVLANRAHRGVRVLCLLDAFGSRGLGDAFRSRLERAGAEVATFRPFTRENLYKVQQRMHIRSVVVDGRTGYTGGFGIDDRWMGDGRQLGSWRDTNVRIEGPIVDELQATFATHWAETTGELLLCAHASGHSVVDDAHTSHAGVLRAVPTLGSTAAERMFVLSILGERHRLYISNAYFVPGRSLRRLMCEAVTRGVDVRVLTPGANTDRRSAWLAARSHYRELLDGGVRVYEYRPTMIHAKTLVADGCWSCIGSVNFDNRSMKLNDEVAVVSDDPVVASRLESLFLEDLEHATEIDRAVVETRSTRDRVAEHAARLVAPLL